MVSPRKKNISPTRVPWVSDEPSRCCCCSIFCHRQGAVGEPSLVIVEVGSGSIPTIMSFRKLQQSHRKARILNPHMALVNCLTQIENITKEIKTQQGQTRIYNSWYYLYMERFLNHWRLLMSGHLFDTTPCIIAYRTKKDVGHQKNKKTNPNKHTITLPVGIWSHMHLHHKGCYIGWYPIS